MSWTATIIIIIALIALVVFVIVRNRKDEKEFEQQLNNTSDLTAHDDVRKSDAEEENLKDL